MLSRMVRGLMVTLQPQHCQANPTPAECGGGRSATPASSTVFSALNLISSSNITIRSNSTIPIVASR